MQAPVTGIDEMPRGGPDASCLDRLLWTDRSEYLDRSDVDPGVRRSVVDALNWTGRVFGSHEQFAAIALEEIADVPDPRILELGAGHGALATKLLEFHPSAHVTVTDVADDAVAVMAAGPLGEHPRAMVRVVDATSIDTPDRQFALAVFALSFHHLPPAAAAAVLAEGTRVADKLLIIDLPRPPAPVHVLRLATMLPLAPFIPFVHDGVISSLRSYSPSALRALADHAGVDIELRNSLFGPQIAVATRR